MLEMGSTVEHLGVESLLSGLDLSWALSAYRQDLLQPRLVSTCCVTKGVLELLIFLLHFPGAEIPSVGP